MTRSLSAALLAVALSLGPCALPAAGQTTDSAATQAAIGPVVTHHEMALPDRRLAYQAVVESLTVGKGDGAARIVVVAYLGKGEAVETRPVTFVFNGGPGASSAYLHLGAMGPRILATPPDGSPPPPPATMQDNPDTWLAFTDLVFVDPVGTGFSEPVKEGEKAERAFWSVSADTGSLAAAIRLWLTRHGRWQAPLYIAGESFGGFRALHLARSLLDQKGPALKGLVLISPAMEFSAISPGSWDVLPWGLMLPSMVAAARAQGKADAQPSMEEVESFALSDYLQGIAAIAPPGAGPDPALVTRVAGLLGLPEDLVRRYHARVPAWVFAERVLWGTGRAVSLYDGTQVGPDPRPGRRGPDTYFDGLKAPLTAAYNAYVRDALGVQTDRPFILLSRDASRHWDWEGAKGGPGAEDGAMDDLEEALSLTPGLGVLVVHGRADMVTPYMASRWLLDRLDLPDAVRARIRLEVLEGGHMMYFRPDQRAALSRAAAEFYRGRGSAS